tara:strand:- start:559 stop:723 length:165 start_codon:yes stop_codon:yes gene_type:complete
MIEVGDLVRIAKSTRHKDKLAIVVGIDHTFSVCALQFLDTNEKENYHISRLEKL